MSGKKEGSASTWTDPDAPELTDEWFADADLCQAGKLIRRGGRPKKATPEKEVSIRLDPDVVAHFQMEGPGWPPRMNAALRKATGL